jgi:hypothetical protein
MDYKPDMAAAARRHIEAADALVGGSRQDVAGYLYGIAAECAIKSMMLDAGMGPRPSDKRRDDPFYAHFPELRTMLRDAQLGRRGAIVQRYIEDDRFLQHWDTSMRYCKGSEIKERWVKRWREQARQAVASIGT